MQKQTGAESRHRIEAIKEYASNSANCWSIGTSSILPALSSDVSKEIRCKSRMCQVKFARDNQRK